MYWVGFDVGGTFIDIFAVNLETASIHTLKYRSSRRHAAGQVREGLQQLLTELGVDASEISRLAHGTTLVTNILVERSGARVGIITTRGFRDVLEIGRMRRPSLYDLYQDKPSPLAPRTDIAEVGERVAADGTSIVPLDQEEVREIVRRLKTDGVETVAVCLIHSYANPSHELQALQIIEEEGLTGSASAQVSAEYGEFERFATAVVNSYCMPAVHKYLGNLANSTRELGISGPLQIMQSNGGVIPVASAQKFPVRLASSGPTAGVTGSAIVAQRIDRRNLITLDMGGTSTDVSLLVNGRAAYISEQHVDGFPIRSVGVDIRSIGAGGGSIAWLDRTGSLRVGPQSAGAEPGPACYGWGGETPTVSDADLHLGFLSADRFCGGRIKLYPEKAEAALSTEIAAIRGTTTDHAALGVIQLCVTNMVGAVRNITMERGYDPRDFVLIPFGGAGPGHATLVAAELNIAEVVVLKDPGLLSAQGLLLSNYRSDVYRTHVVALQDMDCGEVSGLYRQLEAEAIAQLPDTEDPSSLRIRRVIEMCYEGQENMLPVELGSFPVTKDMFPHLETSLRDQFEAIYGFVPKGRRPQVLHLRLFAESLVDTERLLPRVMDDAAPRGAVPASWRPVLFPGQAGRIETAIYDRLDLAPGDFFEGPAIIEENYSTTVILPGQSGRVDGGGNLIIRTGR